MEHIAAIMLLLGCNDSASACTELPAPQVGYETVEICEDAVEPALYGASSDYPMILAKCIPVDPLAEGDLEIVWDINAQNQLVAEAVPLDDDAISLGTVVANIPPVDEGARLR